MLVLYNFTIKFTSNQSTLSDHFRSMNSTSGLEDKDNLNTVYACFRR